MNPADFQMTPEHEAALKIMHDPAQSCFITGKAGTGKSTLLKYFLENTHRNVAVLAPTGVAALNVGGQTIHSFFRFQADITGEKARKAAQRMIKNGDEDLYRILDAIVIDEISMVRADLLDCVDEFLRAVRKKKNLPFGGVKLIFVGDLYQLPPVVVRQEKEALEALYEGPYFFNAQVMKNLDFDIIELEKIFRQSETDFIEVLNAIRNNRIETHHLDVLNARVMDPHTQLSGEDFAICITTTNKRASEINQARLMQLNSKSRNYQSIVSGNFEKSSFPTDDVLELKVGAQVMFVNNDSEGRWVNGTLGVVKKVESDEVMVTLEDQEVVKVTPHTWTLHRYQFDPQKRVLQSDNVGDFTQIPLRLAWAVTIHKSQGKSFDRVFVDLFGRIFATGQLYVALSRCRTLGGLYLSRPLQSHDVLVDYRVVKFLTGQQYSASEKIMSLENKIDFLKQAANDEHVIEMTYLKPSDEKSRRRVRPLFVGELSYQGKPFVGLKAFCLSRNDERVFRVDRILRMERV